MPTTQTFFLMLLYTVLLFPIEAITVSGISSRTGRLASEYWVQGHQIFTNAFEHDDNELGPLKAAPNKATLRRSAPSVAGQAKTGVQLIKATAHEVRISRESRGARTDSL